MLQIRALPDDLHAPAVAAFDPCSGASAEALPVRLLTLDATLVRAQGHGAVIELFGAG